MLLNIQCMLLLSNGSKVVLEIFVVGVVLNLVTDEKHIPTNISNTSFSPFDNRLVSMAPPTVLTS